MTKPVLAMAALSLALASSRAPAQPTDAGVLDLTTMARSAMSCASEPAGCAGELLDGPLAPVVWEAVQRYQAHLFGQAEGRWRPLPDWFLTAAQPYYPDLDLAAIRYADSIDTVHGNHIAWGDRIFFVHPVDLTRDAEVYIMLHEIEHVEQYRAAGGEEPFLRRYLAESLEAVASSGTIDVHGQLALEQAAEAAAQGLTGVVVAARP